MIRSTFSIALLTLLLALPAVADKAPIRIVDPSAKNYRAAVLRFRAVTPGSAEVAGPLRAAIEDGLAFSGLFSSIHPDAFLAPATSRNLDAEPMAVCDSWRQIRADALVQGEIEQAARSLKIEFRVLDVSRGCLRLARKIYRVDPSDRTRVGKAIADDIVGAFTGTPGVSDTEIAFSSDRSGAKEIHVMESDGSRLRRATNHGSIALFPDWSPAGDTILYTSYRYRNRANLFLLTRGAKSPGRILRELNGTAPYRGVFHPGGDTLALVKSNGNGATDLYTVGRGGKNLRKLSGGRSIEVGPSWSPDGRRLAFVSDRAGAPQIYVMNADGSDQHRITFNGGYNAAPAWSPDGRWIAYESRLRGQMDIWLIDPEGRVNVPLVDHPRSDEHPAWSPDGRMLAFSSVRRGSGDIHLIDVNGDHLRAVTEGAGDDRQPAWGPRRR